MSRLRTSQERLKPANIFPKRKLIRPVAFAFTKLEPVIFIALPAVEKLIPFAPVPFGNHLV